MITDYKTILITGGTGSFGQAATCFLLQHTAATVRVYSRSELMQIEMQRAFAGYEGRLRILLGDIRDLPRLTMAMRDVDAVFHAAALKHVDKGERDPAEFVGTNINGTLNVINACMHANVRRAVLLSTDKAVSPINLYGSTKMTAEKVWTRANGYSPHGTRFSTVRYGNVAGSRGSVIGIWRTALERRQPVTVTDPEMSRFWISLDEAVKLAWFAMEHAPRGSILVPHLGAYRMGDLLQAICDEYQVSEPKLRLTGIRPGEKMAEELLTYDEAKRLTCYSANGTMPTYYCISPLAPSWEDEKSPWQPCTIPHDYRSDVWGYRFGVSELKERLQLT